MTDETIKTNAQNHNSRKWIGFCLLFAGGILLAQRSGIPLPVKIIFNWQIFLIIFGIVTGIRKRFRGAGWLMLIVVGTFFYVDDYYPALAIHQYLWPVMLIAVGLVFIFRPHYNGKHKYFDKWDWKEKKQEWKQRCKEDILSSDDHIDITSILSGTKRSILSKDFKGGEAISFLGGTELNFSQADINGQVVLELTQILGGTKLIVPSHWDVRSELVSIFAGVEDRRPLNGSPVDPDKILILRGTSVFGGIDIRSY